MDETDVWNSGALDGFRGTPMQSVDAVYVDGYLTGRCQAKVTVLLPERPEGYYHSKLENQHEH